MTLSTPLYWPGVRPSPTVTAPAMLKLSCPESILPTTVTGWLNTPPSATPVTAPDPPRLATGPTVRTVMLSVPPTRTTSKAAGTDRDDTWGLATRTLALAAPRRPLEVMVRPLFRAWGRVKLRFFDGHSRRQADGASGVYFFGARSESEIAPADIVAFYARQGRR